MAERGRKSQLTSDEWRRLRTDVIGWASARGCPADQVEFVASTAVFATWMAETVDQIPSQDPEQSVGNWSGRMLDALIWSVRRERGGLVDGSSYQDPEAWDFVLTVEDAIPVFLKVAKRDAELIQGLCTGRGRFSEAELKRARQVFRRQVVPALNAIYGTEN